MLRFWGLILHKGRGAGDDGATYLTIGGDFYSNGVGEKEVNGEGQGGMGFEKVTVTPRGTEGERARGHNAVTAKSGLLACVAHAATMQTGAL